MQQLTFTADSPYSQILLKAKLLFSSFQRHDSYNTSQRELRKEANIRLPSNTDVIIKPDAQACLPYSQEAPRETVTLALPGGPGSGLPVLER